MRAKVRGRRATRDISLEEYASFQANLDLNLNLTSDQLNQILSMHGFCKLYRAKVHLLEALGSVQLVSPFRSTLVVGARPAPLTPDDVALDTADLNWRECPMVSMNSLTLGSAAMAAAAEEVEEVGGASHLLQNVAEARRQRSSFVLGPRLHRHAIPKKKRTRRVKVADAELLVTALFGSDGSPSMVDDVLGLRG